MPRRYTPEPDTDGDLLDKAMRDMRLKSVTLSQITGLSREAISAYRRNTRPTPAILWKFLALLRAYRDLRKMRRDTLAKLMSPTAPPS